MFTDSEKCFPFGVEIEFTGCSREQACQTLSAAGLNVQNVGYCHDVQEYWKVVRDGSLDEDDSGELVSPILEGNEGLQQIVKAVRALRKAGASVNRQCGLHVHISVSSFTPEQVWQIVKRYGELEGQIDTLHPRNRRASNNQWCLSIASQVERLAPEGEISEDTLTRLSYRWLREAKLNLRAYSRYGTLEFRQHAGTLDPEKICSWIRFCMAFMVKNGRVRRTTRTRRNTGMRASTKERNLKILRALAENLSCPDAGLAEIAGVAVSSLPAIISQIRSRIPRDAGITIKRRHASCYGNGYYYITAPDRRWTRTSILQERFNNYIAGVERNGFGPVQDRAQQRTQAPSWQAGLPADLVSFYQERAADLS